jgi:predicted PurR-regulated permease PerM
MMGLQLGERQRATVAAAITLVAALFLAGAVLWMFALLGRFVSFFSGVFLPLAVAGMLALLVRPFYVAVLRGVRHPAVAMLTVFAVILVPLVGLIWLFGAVIAGQVGGLVERVPVWLDRAQVELQQRTPELLKYWRKWELGDRLRTFMSQQGGAVAQSLGSGLLIAGAGVSRTISGLLGWVVLPVYFAFFLSARPSSKPVVDSMLPFLRPALRADLTYLVQEFIGIMVAFFRGQVIIASLQGVLYAIGFVLIGLQFGIVLGLFMGLMNIIPYLGSLLGLALVIPTAYFQDGGGLITVLLAFGVIMVVQGIEGYLLTPRIMGDRTGLHPVAIIFAIFFWGTALGGVLGMILAIPLTAFLVVFWRLLKAKYIKEVL